MTEVAVFKSYDEYKAELDRNLSETVEGFVRIGYLLKIARDSNILFDSGYKNIYDFAFNEYNLDKTQVSRFININDRFSEGGYSDTLQDKYKGFGYAKLSIMLTLPDSVNEVITPEYSKNDLRVIREEYVEEQKITDIEVMLEEKSEETESLARDVLYHYYMDEGNLDEFKALCEDLKSGQAMESVLQDELLSSGQITVIARIPGQGRWMMTVQAVEDAVLTNMRSGEKKRESWQQLIDAYSSLVKREGTPEEIWESLYDKKIPKVEKKEIKKVAPVQPVKSEKKAPKKKEKVKAAKKMPQTRIKSQSGADFDKPKEKAENEMNLHDYIKQCVSKINLTMDDCGNNYKNEQLDVLIHNTKELLESLEKLRNGGLA